MKKYLFALLLTSLTSCTFNVSDNLSEEPTIQESILPSDSIYNSLSEEIIETKYTYTLHVRGYKHQFEKCLNEEFNDINVGKTIYSSKHYLSVYDYDYYIDKELTTQYAPLVHIDIFDIYLKENNLSYEYGFDYIYEFMDSYYDISMSYEEYVNSYYEIYKKNQVNFVRFESIVYYAKNDNNTRDAFMYYFTLENGEYKKYYLTITLNEYYYISTDNYIGSCMIEDDNGIAQKGSAYVFDPMISSLYIDLSDLTIYENQIDNVCKNYNLTEYSYTNGIFGNQLLGYLERHCSFDFDLGVSTSRYNLDNYEVIYLDDTHFYVQIENKKYYFEIETYGEYSYYHIYKVESKDVLFEGKNYQETLRILNILFGSNGLKDFCVEVILNEDCTFTLNVGYVVISG